MLPLSMPVEYPSMHQRMALSFSYPSPPLSTSFRLSLLVVQMVKQGSSVQWISTESRFDLRAYVTTNQIGWLRHLLLPFSPPTTTFSYSFYFYSHLENNTTHPNISHNNNLSRFFKTGKQETTTTMAARFLDMALDDVAKSRAANNRSPASRRGARGAGLGGAGAGSGRDSPNRSNRASPYSVRSPSKKRIQKL